jgi:hypothetical protein
MQFWSIYLKPDFHARFAYVDFATPEAKLAAIERSENPLTGRKLLIKDGEDNTEADKPQLTTFFR